IVLTRQCVNALRALGQQHTELKYIIAQGNEDGTTFQKPICPVHLMRIVDMRWSLTYLMIKRFLKLYPALQILLSCPHNNSLTTHILTDAELEVLSNICHFLWVPYRVREILVGKQYLTACLVLPLYKHLLTKLKVLWDKLPSIEHGIEASVEALKRYMH
ncbi:hypothetical protein C8Q80DRAFT_1093670, partial [Daedaleopsis nitida]